jgi:ribonuclease J
VAVSVAVTVFGGAGEIGGNQIRIQDRDACIWLDFGCPMSRRSRFYDSFAGPRATLGMHDLLALGLVPELPGLYRRDLLLPGRSALSQGEPPVAILLSHCHFDHSGYISLLDTGIPVYSSALTALLAKATQDTAADDMESEVVYTIDREERQGLLAASHYRKSPAKTRRWIGFGRPQPSVREFWGAIPGARGISGPPLEVLDGDEATMGPFVVRHYPVDHSVPGASAWAVKTSQGWIAYTGDFRYHGTGAGKTQEAFLRIARLCPAVLICEATHPQESWPASEAAVRENSLAALRLSAGTIMVDYGSRNLERLLTFSQVSRALGRRIAVSPRDWYLLEALSLDGASGLGDVSSGVEGACLYVAHAKLNRPSWERIVIERFVGEYITGPAARHRSDEFVIGLGFYDLAEMIDLLPSGGTFLRSISEAWNEEEVLNLERLKNWTSRFGVRFLGGDVSGHLTFHSSGHVDGHGLRHCIETIHPGTVVPVHTEKPSLIKKLCPGTRVVIPVPGRSLPL